MRSRMFLSALILMISFLMISGCDITLGPKVKTVYAIVYPGKPIEILQNAKVIGRVLNAYTLDPVTQDIGGWIAMPPEHWELIQKKLATKDIVPK